MLRARWGSNLPSRAAASLLVSPRARKRLEIQHQNALAVTSAVRNFLTALSVALHVWSVWGIVQDARVIKPIAEGWRTALRKHLMT